MRPNCGIENLIRESAWTRAVRDTEAFRRSGGFFWSICVLWSAFFAILGFIFIPDNTDVLESAAYPIVGAVLGIATVHAGIYIGNLVKAPYHQRNEARIAIEQSQVALAYERLIYDVVSMCESGLPPLLNGQPRLSYEKGYCRLIHDDGSVTGASIYSPVFD